MFRFISGNLFFLQFHAGCLLFYKKITLPVRRRSQVSQAGCRLIPIVLFVPVKGVELCHFRIGQLEAVQFGVLLDMVGIAGAGNDHHALLEIPAQDITSE